MALRARSRRSGVLGTATQRTWRSLTVTGWASRSRRASTTTLVAEFPSRGGVSCSTTEVVGSHWSRGQVNELRPSRRPRHTLTPGLAQRAGSLAFAFGCMGGDGQPQTQMQLLTHLRTGQDPQEAIVAPRWYIDIQTAGRSRVLVESRVKASVIRELRRRGHHVVRLGPYEEVMGHAQVISVEPSGALVGGADPRTDGHVAGW